MARQSNIKLKGTVGNVVFYQWKGIDCIRTKPSQVRQAPVAIKNAGIFGMAANRSAVLRSLLKPILPQPSSRVIMRRMDAVFRQWLHTEPLNNPTQVNDLPCFTGVSFNEKNELKSFGLPALTCSRAADNQLLLQLPAFDPTQLLKTPPGTGKMVLQVMIAGLHITEPITNASHQIQIIIDFTTGVHPAQDLPLTFTTATGQLTIVALALEFYTGTTNTGFVDTLPWKPAGIVGSFYN